MRSDLKAVQGVTEIETDLDTMTCSFVIDGSIDAEKLLNSLAESNNKISDWTVIK